MPGRPAGQPWPWLPPRRWQYPLSSRPRWRADLQEVLEVTAGNLSQHLTVLEDAGHVQIAKTFEDKRPRTWVTVTRKGRAALGSEVATMRALLDGIGGGQRP